MGPKVKMRPRNEKRKKKKEGTRNGFGIEGSRPDSGLKRGTVVPITRGS